MGNRKCHGDFIFTCTHTHTFLNLCLSVCLSAYVSFCLSLSLCLSVSLSLLFLKTLFLETPLKFSNSLPFLLSPKIRRLQAAVSSPLCCTTASACSVNVSTRATRQRPSTALCSRMCIGWLGICFSCLCACSYLSTSFFFSYLFLLLFTYLLSLSHSLSLTHSLSLSFSLSLSISLHFSPPLPHICILITSHPHTQMIQSQHRQHPRQRRQQRKPQRQLRNHVLYSSATALQTNPQCWYLTVLAVLFANA